jgi:hypothetical protein
VRIQRAAAQYVGDVELGESIDRDLVHLDHVPRFLELVGPHDPRSGRDDLLDRFIGLLRRRQNWPA